MLNLALSIILVFAWPLAQSPGLRPTRSPELVKEQAYAEFNKAVAELRVEDEALWNKLREGMLADPPGCRRWIDQEAVVKDLIEANERKISALKRLLELMKQ